MFKAVIKKYRLHRNAVDYWKSRGAHIGEGCEIYTTASLGSEPYLITIGNNVRINEGVILDTHDGGVWVLRNLDSELYDIDLFGSITIGNNVHIGHNSIIMPGVSIGDNVIIGCNAIVTSSIPSNSVAVGVPARVIETIDEYKEKHIHDFVHTAKMDPKTKEAYLKNEWIKK